MIKMEEVSTCHDLFHLLIFCCNKYEYNRQTGYQIWINAEVFENNFVLQIYKWKSHDGGFFILYWGDPHEYLLRSNSTNYDYLYPFGSLDYIINRYNLINPKLINGVIML
jgi:hypothetical protein